MAVKIIKRGEKPEEKEFKFVCQNCKSELEALVKDIQVDHGTQREPHPPRHYIKCPVCNRDICMSKEARRQWGIRFRFQDAL